MKAPKKIEVKMLEAEGKEAEQKILVDEVKQIKEYLLNEATEQCVQEFTVDDGKGKILSALVIEKKSIDFDFEKIMSKLDKRQIDTVFNKTYQFDIEQIKQLCQNDPSLHAKLKPAITVVKTINEEKFDTAVANGLIAEDDIKDCYTITKSKYLKLQRVKAK